MEEEILTLKGHFNTHEDVKQELEDLLKTSEHGKKTLEE